MTNDKYYVPIENKCNLSIPEATAYFNIGKNKISKLLKAPNCPFLLKVGAKQLVKRKEFEEFISNHTEI